MNKTSDINLPVPIGNTRIESLVDLQHILMAGETGSGKSNFNHVLINSLIKHYSPVELKLFLSDVKRVEFRGFYGNLTYLFDEVREDINEVFTGLEAVNKEREKRLKVHGSNEPFIVVVIDTFSDLIANDSEKFESLIKDLTSGSQKTKIHVVMCDSRTSSDVFTQNILDCFPTKIAFKTYNSDDSILVIGKPGAEKLKGAGDMLFLPPGASDPIHLQAPVFTN